MTKFLMRTKRALLCVLSALLALSLALGIAAMFAGSDFALAEEQAKSSWLSSNKKTTFDAETGITKVEGASILANSQNILELPNRTAVFQMQADKSAAWSGIALLNGLESKECNWDNVTWPGVNKGIDTLPHLIFQDESGQMYGNTVKDKLGKDAVGVSNVPADISKMLIGVEIHIGEGGDDVSYIKMSNKQLTLEKGVDGSALKFATVADFPNGCYVGIHINLTADSAGIINLSEFGTPFVSGAGSRIKQDVLLYEKPFTSSAPITVMNLADLNNVTVKVNGEEVTDFGETSLYEKVVDEANGKFTFKFKPTFWTTMKLPRENTVTIGSTNGNAVFYMTVISSTPPQWTGDSFKVIDDVADTAFTFTMKGDEVTASQLTIYSSVYSGNLDKSNALKPEDDYTLSKDGDVYTLTFKSAYLEKVLSVYHGRYFYVQIGESTLIAQLYHRQETAGWVARSVDLTKDTALTVNDYYTSGNYVKFNENALVPRIYYNQAIDVTKPIFVEFSGFDSGTEWGMFQVADSLMTMDYFSDKTKNDAELQALFFGGRNDLQKFSGFVATASTNASYDVTTMKNIVIEVFFGTDDAQGYFKVNGSNCGTPTSKQSDFKDGTAYIGWFVNRTVGPFDLTLNSHVNAVAIAAPLDDAKYTMDLAKAADFTLDLQNTSGNLKLSNEKGYTLVKDKDYTYNAETGKLTLKAAYFSGLAFSKDSVISIWDNTAKTGTQFKMIYSSSNMNASSVAFGTVGSLADAVFTMPASVTSVSSVIGGDGKEVDAKHYSFANGKLTVKKDILTDKEGVTEFIAVSGSALYPCYVYTRPFKDGGYQASGKGTLTSGNGAYMIEGDMGYTFMKGFNFESGAAFKLDFKSTPGYYKGGLNYANAGYVTLRFYDPYSGYTFIYSLFTNYAKDDVTANNTALFETYSMVDSENVPVILETTRPVNIATSENSLATGVHILRFVAEEGALKISVDNARAVTIGAGDLGIFNLSASVCTVETPASAESGAMKVGVQFFEASDKVDYSEITVEKPDDNKPGPEPEKRGCGGNIAASAFAVSAALLALGAVLVIARKKKN